MKIITLTLNPAFDIHCNVPNFALYHENLADVTSNDAGGKGVNISRALTVNGVDNVAFVVLGEENGAAFETALKTDVMNYKSVWVRGRIRENITCHTEGAPETRISFRGFSADASLLEKTYTALAKEIDGDTVVTFTGRAPEGISMGDIKAFLGRLKEKGAKIVIDSRSFTLDDIRDVKPWLIKPNQEEISEYLGREIKDFDQITDAAEQLHGDGIENVMISLGSDGAMLVCDEGVFVASAPKIDVVSTIGAGDSSIAGFLCAASDGLDATEKLLCAVAYGSAKCMSSGTKPPERENVQMLLSKTSVKKIK